MRYLLFLSILPPSSMFFFLALCLLICHLFGTNRARVLAQLYLTNHIFFIQRYPYLPPSPILLSSSRSEPLPICAGVGVRCLRAFMYPTLIHSGRYAEMLLDVVSISTAPTVILACSVMIHLYLPGRSGVRWWLATYPVG